MPLGRVADYELLEQLGQGGMGVVFKARDARLGRLVALKLLTERLADSPEHRRRFLREARAEASLNHSSIATCYDVGEGRLDPPDLLSPDTPGPHPDRVLYLSMEYVPGTDLAGLIGDRPLQLDRVLDLGIQLASGLEAAHASGVVHRDLKPSNVRVTPDGRVKILDFGLARVLRDVAPEASTPSVQTSDDRILGTLLYMSPEQAQGHAVDGRSDLFSFGVILFQLVTGRLPIQGATNLEVLYAIANEEPPPLTRYASGVPDELERIVRKLLAKSPDDRYQSAHEMRTDLERLRQLGPRAQSTRRRRRPRTLAIAIAGLGVACAAAWWAWTAFGAPVQGSVAVMPFDNLTGDVRLAYLGDGLAAEVLGHLVRGGGLNVASLSAARDAARQERSVRRIARELGVRAVVKGALRGEGGSTRLDVELVDGRTGFLRWASQYEYTLDNALQIERDIATQVSSRVAGGRTGTRPAPGTEPATITAYALALRAGPRLEDADDPRGPDDALGFYDQAIALDSAYALAWTGRSRALFRIWRRDRNVDTLHLSQGAAQHALDLSPELIEGRIALAQIYRATGRHAESIRELESVMQANPNWDEALLQLAASYRDAGDLDRAQKCLQRATELRPGYWKNWNALGALLVRRGDYASAKRAFAEIVRLAPEKNRGYEQLAALAILQGDNAAAVATYQRLPGPVQDAALASNIGTAYFFERRLGDARRYYQLAVELEPRNVTSWTNLGDLFVRAGYPDSARASYRVALRLAEEQMHGAPGDVMTRLEHVLLLAKSGDCLRAGAELRNITNTLTATDAEGWHVASRIYALCGDVESALAGLRRAIALGVPPRVIQAEDEFARLATDNRFRALLHPVKP